MNKAELVAAIATKADITKKDSEKALKAVIDVITAAASMTAAIDFFIITQFPP